MKTSIVIYADEGKVLTNGETYGRQIFLADGELISDYHEITEAQYEQIQAQESENAEVNMDVY